MHWQQLWHRPPITRVTSWTLILAGVAGSLLSIEALTIKYGAGVNATCDLGAVWNCDLVNHSVYATQFGLPVAGLGLVGYLLLALIAMQIHRSDRAWHLLFGWCAFSLAFSLYLTYLEFFRIGTICALCVSSLLLVIAVSGLSIWTVSGRPRTVAPGQSD